ncbi:hypothetical protein Pfo_024607 [Paulownia fortunei]|nr:hypothetical protein Pfo_024607 [Paulownia fortunei]
MDSETESLHSSFGGNGGKEVTADKVFDEIPQKDADKVFEKMPTPAAPKAQWLDLFRDNRNVSQGIKLNVVESNSDDEVALEAHELDEVEKAWGFCLVGYFVVKFSGKTTLLQLCESWNVKYKYFAHSSG